MTDSVRKHLPIIVVVSLVGVATAAFGMLRVADAAASFDVSMFSMMMLVVPCAVMLVGSFAIAATATRIERQLYVVVLGICFVLGLVSLAVGSILMSDPSTASTLAANSAEGVQVVPDTQSPVLAMRDIAAYVVVPTIGCIAGAWAGSRIHPMTAESRKGGNRK